MVRSLELVSRLTHYSGLATAGLFRSCFDVIGTTEGGAFNEELDELITLL